MYIHILLLWLKRISLKRSPSTLDTYMIHSNHNYNDNDNSGGEIFCMHVKMEFLYRKEANNNNWIDSQHYNNEYNTDALQIFRTNLPWIQYNIICPYTYMCIYFFRFWIVHVRLICFDYIKCSKRIWIFLSVVSHADFTRTCTCSFILKAIFLFIPQNIISGSLGDPSVLHHLFLLTSDEIRVRFL